MIFVQLDWPPGEGWPTLSAWRKQRDTRRDQAVRPPPLWLLLHLLRNITHHAVTSAQRPGVIGGLDLCRIIGIDVSHYEKGAITKQELLRNMSHYEKGAITKQELLRNMSYYET